MQRRNTAARTKSNRGHFEIRPVTAPSNKQPEKSSSHSGSTSTGRAPNQTRSNSPLPPRARTVTGTYDDQRYAKTRSRSPGNLKGTKSLKRQHKSKKTGTSVQLAWAGSTDIQTRDHRRNKYSDSSSHVDIQVTPPENISFIINNVAEKTSRTSSPRLSTGSSRKVPRFKSEALVPGSVSTIVTLTELVDEERQVDDDAPTEREKPPTFMDIFNTGTDADYETDLEEDFPEIPKVFDPSGKNQYIRMCKDKDLVNVSFLADRFMSKEITMRYHGLGSHGTIPIAKALVKNTFTEVLDLTGNYIESVGATALARMLVDNCFISELNLSENFLRPGSGTDFSQMLLRNSSLKKLVLRSNYLTDKDAKAFAEALKENRTLEHLDLSNNEIGEMGGIYLGAGLGMNYGLKHLNLSWNSIRFKGAVGMAQALKTNDCLSHLNLSWNGLSLLGCVAIGRWIKKNESLKDLDISNNRVGLLGVQKLAAGLAVNTTLQALKIGKNPIGDGGVEALLNVLRTHSTLKFLSLEDITLSPKLFDEIVKLESEKSVKVIHGGLGGYTRPKELPPGMRILMDFIDENKLRLIDWFHQFDKDRSGGISRAEFKKGLKETGLVMTQRQLDRLIEFIDVDDNGEIEFSELLRGREVTIQQLRQERKLEERQKKIDSERMRLPKLEGYDYDLM